MYRQILVHPDDRKYQKILWYHEGKIRTFVLNTVTFGTSCAPFLAIRTLQQLAQDEARDFPRACQLLRRDFYVDDFISGADSIEEVLTIRDEMIKLLDRGGFVIRQWASNQVEVLNNIDKKIFNLECGVKTNSIHKTLGIIWDSERDMFTYVIKPIDVVANSTKRKLVSAIARIYDPLGLLGPVILGAKALIQDCWKAKITWDESLPQSIYTKWASLASQLPHLQDFGLPRPWKISHAVHIEIHGFCDASSLGYGACLYIKTIDSNDVSTVRLVGSKSRVAPLSGITIPRLELSAAVMLKKLFVESKSQFDFPIDRTIFWSDSTIVLCWLKKAPHLLRTFESNRVAEIQSLEDHVEWRHIRSEENPADSLSRGQMPSEFLLNSLWFSGPCWLACTEPHWPPSIQSTLSDLPGLRKGVCLFIHTPFKDIYSRFSSFQRLVRVVAYILRWRKSSTKRTESSSSSVPVEISKTKSDRSIPPLLCSEINSAERSIFFSIQQECFAAEVHILKQALNTESDIGAVSGRRRTKFDELNPFLDEQGLIRVGGRLKKAQLAYNRKHPLLLPSRHHVSDLIIRDVHERNFHSGIQATLYVVRERFWILNGKNQVRSIIRRCIQCVRQKPQLMYSKMADLPQSRVSEAPAFCHTGVDFFGPILIKEKKDRNRSFLKTYGCVFICMASKAVHIELATDLSSEGFLAAFRRFISRRGVPSHVYSDNGTNFVGANKELLEIFKLFDSPDFQHDIGDYALSRRIQWHFNPPLSPHFGGLWEAAVKSFKHHLKRVLKDQPLTYEQLNTLLIEIEAILNSRPLCAISSDPNDPLPITPAHLLIGRPFNFLPEQPLVSVSDNRLPTYKFITKARQDFWARWHKEYLNELQTRQKWRDSPAALTPGSVVILMEDNLGCARWPLGVVIEVFPGSDGITRVASVKTASGVYKRNVTRLCVLPIV